MILKTTPVFYVSPESEKKAKRAYRVWNAAVFAVAERSSPDEVNSDGFESSTESDVLKPMTLSCLTPVLRSNWDMAASTPAGKR